MISSFHEMMSGIQYRYLNQWQPSSLPNNIPDINKAGERIEHLDRKLKTLLDKQFIITKESTIDHQYFKQFINIKQESIIESWPVYPPSHDRSRPWFYYDRLLIEGFHFLLTQIIIHTQERIDINTCPSLYSLADYHFTTPPDCLRMFGSPIKDFQWLQKFRMHIHSLPYHVERVRLEKQILLKENQRDENAIAYQFYQSVFHRLPTTRQEEKQLTSVFNTVRQFLSGESSQIYIDEAFRKLMHQLITTSDPYKEWIVELIDIYWRYWEKMVDKQEFKTENQFWHHQYQYHPENWYLNYLATQFASINEQFSNAQNFQKPPFTWTSTVQDFIKYFHPLIAKGAILQNGNNDMVPIVTSLHRTFDIPKSRGVGSVSCQSLLTYFKNTNAEKNIK